MAAFMINKQAVKAAINSISETAHEYSNAANDFEGAFNISISQMDGATKDALQNHFRKTVLPFLKETIPFTVNGMAIVLQKNLDSFIEADQQMANRITDGYLGLEQDNKQ